MAKTQKQPKTAKKTRLHFKTPVAREKEKALHVIVSALPNTTGSTSVLTTLRFLKSTLSIEHSHRCPSAFASRCVAALSSLFAGPREPPTSDAIHLR
eukprot:scaffold164898_cov36-Tisochrysis_lutea.AAC.1